MEICHGLKILIFRGDYMRITRTFTEKEFDREKKILIYGAGNYGTIALGGLKKLGISPTFIVDKNHAGERYHNIPVISTEDIADYKNDIFLIASLNYFGEIVERLMEKKIENIYDIEYLISICPDCYLDEYTLDEKNNIDKYRNVINNYYPNQLVIGHVEVVLTEKCTLKCKDCANLMQYYEKPENIEMDNIFETFDNFLSTIDVLLEMRVLGGEPFLVKDIDKLIEHYACNEKIKKITIYTNSTIIPDKNVVKSLKNEKVSVHMSNYGKVSRKIDGLDRLFSKEGIRHYIHEYRSWNDLGDIKERKYTDKIMKKLYSECIMAKCYTFYRGKLYMCPRSAHGERLGAFINSEKEYINYTGMVDSEQTKKELIEMLKHTEWLTACNYCNGSCVRSKNVPAAEQMIR